MASSVIKKNFGVNRSESITFPFTPDKDGIAIVTLQNSVTTSSLTKYEVIIKEDNSLYFVGHLFATDRWSVESFAVPMRKGKTYTVITTANSNITADMTKLFS